MKYLSHKVVRHGVRFDSAAEADRHDELMLLEKQGLISELELQKGFEIIPKLTRREVVTRQLKTKVSTKVVERTEEQNAMYHCDFYYYDRRIGKYVIEEFKSPMTAKLADYILRRKLIKQLISHWNEECGNEKYIFREIISTVKTKSKTIRQWKKQL